MDPLQRKQEEDARLSKEITNKSNDLIDIIRNEQQAYEEAQKVIANYKKALEEAHLKFLEFLKTKGIAEVTAKNHIVIRRKRG